MTEQDKPFFVIEPKVEGQGIVIKKDGTISKPEEPKEKLDGKCNPDDRSA
jgi:hypothetical protein